MTTIGSRQANNGTAGAIAAALAAAAFTVCLVYVAVAAGPANRASIDWANAAEIAREDAALCAKLGSPPPGDAFTACSRMLNQVRNGQSRRTQVDMAGF